jgi:holliday junction DNA helicase RuvB
MNPITRFFNWIFEPLQAKPQISYGLEYFNNSEYYDRNLHTKGITKETYYQNKLYYDKLFPLIDDTQSYSSNKKPTSSIYRPQTFDDYIGQSNAKDLLQAFIEGTQSRCKIFPHTLIYGAPGTGKTTLARIIANYLQKDFTEVIASNVEDESKLIETIESVDGNILFVDECHGLNREIVESIYSIMEDFSLGDIVFKPFTLIGATTEIGEIIATRKPFYDRFKIKIELQDYTPYELGKIVRNYRYKVFPTDDNIGNKTYKIISLNCRATPRIAISLLESCIYMGGSINKTLKALKIIDKGYTEKDLKVLEYLKRAKAPTGLEALSLYLGTSKENYTHEIEPYLIKTQTILRTPRGRQISPSGSRLITNLKNKLNKKTR